MRECKSIVTTNKECGTIYPDHYLRCPSCRGVLSVEVTNKVKYQEVDNLGQEKVLLMVEAGDCRFDLDSN